MKIKPISLASTLALAVALAATSTVNAGVIPAHQLSNPWFTDAQASMADKASQKNTQRAKNVILFVGDGMGISTLTAARILQGQNNGHSGEEGLLSFEHFPHSALVKTYNVDAQTPDSAGTMTAMVSGIKTDKGIIGLNEDANYGDCQSAQGNEVVTALELAEIAGLASGVISTARITHATPAATYAKSANRNWEDISDMAEVSGGQGCEDIASQLVNFEANLEARYPGIDVDGIDVVMGGGRRHFMPKDAQYNLEKALSESPEGDRSDGRHLINEWQAHYTQGRFLSNQADFDALDTRNGAPVFALFNESHMRYEADRGNDIGGEPSLSAMTQKAIEVLAHNENGFFLTVEAGRIDHGHHAGNAYNALEDTIELSRAVQIALDNTNPAETLILVTADHSHVMTMAGYPKRGNPILGKVISVGQTEPQLAADGQPYTTLGYANGLGFMDLAEQTNADAGYGHSAEHGHHVGRADLTSVNTQAPGFHQEATVPLGSETHAGEDITLHANGPGAHLAQGVMEQSNVFHIIKNALGLNSK